MADAVAARERGALPARPARRFSTAWLGLVPFFLFSIAFMFLPALYLFVGSFQKDDQFTLQNYADLQTGIIPGAFLLSIEISLVTAIAGGIFGFMLAYAVIMGGLPGFLRTAVMTFSGVASNFAGVPLALAFIFTLGQLGVLTVFLRGLGFDLYSGNFRLTGKLGLEIVYLYFQIPLMVLIIAPAIDGLKKEWREAAENMGATPSQYWRRVALPILTPSILGTMVLLFGNSFGAQATAYQFTGGTLNIVTLVISSQIRGDVLHNPGLGFAAAMGMVVIMGISIGLYTVLQRRAERWLRS
ncbi:MAG TPA: ABC transporter permease subunit [Candidatus Limnocylindrales bacterium]|nr:ABC transporter permease subunit [Candidatus Limnocylindrales bacterium]